MRRLIPRSRRAVDGDRTSMASRSRAASAYDRGRGVSGVRQGRQRRRVRGVGATRTRRRQGLPALCRLRAREERASAHREVRASGAGGPTTVLASSPTRRRGPRIGCRRPATPRPSRRSTGWACVEGTPSPVSLARAHDPSLTLGGGRSGIMLLRTGAQRCIRGPDRSAHRAGLPQVVGASGGW